MKLIERHDLHHPDGRALFVYGELRGTLPSEGSRGGLTELPAFHQRYDALTDSWVAISPSRNARPLSGNRFPTQRVDDCPLCPGGPEVPFDYEAAVFENRFPTFTPNAPSVPPDPRFARAVGRCEVVLYTSTHVGSLATLPPEGLSRVVAVWRDRSEELWAEPCHRFVMIFENRGEAVGATISHPHGQIFAFDRIPPNIAQRLAVLKQHRLNEDDCLGCRLVATDLAASERVVARRESFTIAVPFSARWPYEVHVRARRHGLRRLTDLTAAEQRELAGVLREVVLRYDKLFAFELPYMMTVMEAPAGADDWHLTVEFMPPHRDSQLMKIRASVETATGFFINDTLPESCAAQLAATDVPPSDDAPASTVVRSAL